MIGDVDDDDDDGDEEGEAGEENEEEQEEEEEEEDDEGEEGSDSSSFGPLKRRPTHTQTASHPYPITLGSLGLRLINTHAFSHSDPLKPRLTHAQTHHATIRSITDWLTLKLIHTQTHSHTDALALIFTHTHTHSNPGSIAPRLTHTQNQSLSDLLFVTLILADCGNVSSERFALAHRRSLTDIHRKTYQENEMHIWGAPRRVILDVGLIWKGRKRPRCSGKQDLEQPKAQKRGQRCNGSNI